MVMKWWHVMVRNTIGGGVMWMSVPYNQAGEGRNMAGSAC
jgi:hypothetical protein